MFFALVNIYSGADWRLAEAGRREARERERVADGVI